LFDDFSTGLKDKICEDAFELECNAGEETSVVVRFKLHEQVV